VFEYNVTGSKEHQLKTYKQAESRMCDKIRIKISNLYRKWCCYTANTKDPIELLSLNVEQ